MLQFFYTARVSNKSGQVVRELKRRTKNIFAMIAVTIVLAASSFVSHADNNGWVKERENGESVWHYYQNDKMKVLSWIYDSENGWWFYVNEDGVMETGWGTGYAEGSYFNEDGIMVTGWQQLYPMDEEEITPTTPFYWYYFGEDGQRQTGWLKIDSDWYYFADSQMEDYEEGQMVTGLVTIQGNTYYFDEMDGRLQKGKLLTLDGDKYYFSATGIMKKDSWVKVDNYTYYVGADGRALTGRSSYDLYVTTIDSVAYAFNASGRLVTSRTIYYVDGCWTVTKPVTAGEYSTYTMNVYGKGSAGTYTVNE